MTYTPSDFPRLFGALAEIEAQIEEAVGQHPEAGEIFTQFPAWAERLRACQTVEELAHVAWDAGKHSTSLMSLLASLDMDEAAVRRGVIGRGMAEAAILYGYALISTPLDGEVEPSHFHNVMMAGLSLYRTLANDGFAGIGDAVLSMFGEPAPEPEGERVAVEYKP